ncbi:hypothetical protein ES703_112714 [subsurface metagenome]
MNDQLGRSSRESTPSHISQVLANLKGNKIEVRCQDCGEKFETTDLGVATKRICDKCGAKREERQRQREEESKRLQEEERYRSLIRLAAIPPKWKEVTFATLDLDIQPAAQKIAREYAEKFSKDSPSLVFFSREYGTGKTTLAACIANHILHERRLSVMFKKARDLMLEIRRTFSDRWGGEGEAEILDKVSYVDLLVLDDVGHDPPSDWISTTYWTVLDRRLDWGLPVVVTTNRPFEGNEELLCDRIGVGAASRLLGLCQHNIIEMSGEDLR